MTRTRPNPGNANANDSILVTGASRGIGMETALCLAQRGFRVWASMRDLSQAACVLDEARRRGLTLEAIRLDVTEPQSIDAALGTILQRSGSLYGLVNNAGMTRGAYFEDFPEDEARRIFEVNLIGVMNVTKRVLPHLRAAGRGRIIMISSIGGRIASMGMAPYFASKFAIEGLSESLYLELAPFGIQVVIVEPGMVKTDIWDKEQVYLPAARNPRSPYYKLFQRVLEESEALLASSGITPADVASVVARALTIERPRFRYTIGWRARLLVSLRRHLPGELFEKIYFGEVLRRVTRPTRHSGAADL